MRPYIPALALVLASAPFSASVASAQDVAMVGEFKLPGGAIVVTSESHKRPAVIIETWLRTGSVDDPAGLGGLAYVTANAVFFDPSFTAAVKALGGSGMVAVDREFTRCKVEVPAARLEAALALIGQALNAPDWDAFNIADDVAAARSEAVRIAANREEAAVETYLAKAYPAPYGHPRAGDAASLGRIGKADVRGFFERNYVPSRLRVVLAGDFDTGRSVGQVVNGYAAMLKRVAPADGTAPARGGTATATWTGGQPVVVAGMKGPGLKEVREQAAFEMLGEVMKARLTAAMNEPDTARLASIRFVRFSERSPLVVTIAAKPEATAAVENALQAAINDMRSNPVTLEEHARAQKAVAEGNTQVPDNVGPRAAALGFAVTVVGDPTWQRTYPEIVRQVSRQEMMEAVQKYATPLNLMVTTFSR